MDETLRMDLVNLLMDLDMYSLSSDENQMSIRCPFCLDSVSDAYAKSLSIDVSGKNGGFPYLCFRAGCDATGVVDSDFLDRLGLSDIDLGIRLDQNNKLSRSKGYARSGKGYYKKELHNVVNLDKKLNASKLNYLSRRLGVELTEHDAFRFKISLDLLGLMKSNNAKIEDNKYNKIKRLSDYGIGFISIDNDYVIVRDITNGKYLDKRYDNVRVFNRKDSEKTKMYAIPNKYDIMAPRVRIIVCEGVISLMGVFFHIEEQHMDPTTFYIAACGAGMSKAVRHILKEYMIFEADVDAYVEDGVPDSICDDLLNIKGTDIRLTICRNTMSDDTGTTANNINIIRSTRKKMRKKRI